MSADPRHPMVRRALRRGLLDGRYRWGSERMRPRRYGGGIRRIDVHAPDAPRHLLRSARMSRGWPVIAPATAVPTGALAAEITGAAMSLAVAVAMLPLLALCWVLARVSAGVRAHSVSVIVTTRNLATASDDPRWVVAEQLVWRLQDAEDDLDGGLIDSGSYARVWSECYVDATRLANARPA